MTSLVTGGAGHLGNNVVRLLLARGRKVRVLVRASSSSLEGLPIERRSGDLLDRASLEAACDGVDVVYHFAAVVSLAPRDREHVLRTNVLGTRNVVEACLARGVRRLVHASSIHALAPRPGSQVTDETAPPNTDRHRTAYDRSKTDGEAEVHKGIDRGLDAVILNPTAVIGPHDYVPRLAGRALIDMYAGRLPISVAGGFDWVDARDVAAAALSAASRGRSRERYLLSGHWASMSELAALMREATGRAGPRIVAPLWLAWAGIPFLSAYAKLTASHPLYTAPALRALKEHRACDNSKARAELHFTPRPLSRTIADTFAFYTCAGLLAPAAREGTSLPAQSFVDAPDAVEPVAT
jgi:dihydroflavonol-4-reductase